LPNQFSEGTGIDELKDLIVNYKSIPTEPCLNASSIDPEYFNSLRKAFPNQLLYKLWLVITQSEFPEFRTKRNSGSFTKSLRFKTIATETIATSLSTMS
jgi:ferrous iron transport protein B